MIDAWDDRRGTDAYSTPTRSKGRSSPPLWDWFHPCGTWFIRGTLRFKQRRAGMAKAKKRTSRGRKQDRARVAGGQDYETRYEAKKTGKSRAAVKKAVKKVGNSRKRVERSLSR